MKKYLLAVVVGAALLAPLAAFAQLQSDQADYSNSATPVTGTATPVPNGTATPIPNGTAVPVGQVTSAPIAPVQSAGAPLNIVPQNVSNTGASTNTSCAGNAHCVVNPLGVTSICGLIKSLLGAAIAIGIPIAVLFIVWAGLKFVLARGNSEALASARSNMLYTVIGIAIFLGAWLLASVIQNTVNALASGSGQNTISSCN